MTALYIVLGMAAFFAFLLFSRISVKVDVKDNIKLSIRYLFLKFDPLKEKKKDRTKSKEKAENQKENALKRMVKQNGLRETVSLIFETMKSAVEALGKLLHHVKVKSFKLDIRVASEDPMLTAVEYGGVCAVVYPAVTFLDSVMVFDENRTSVSVSSDFTATNPTIEFYGKFKCRLIFLIAMAIKVVLPIVKDRISKGNKSVDQKSVAEKI